MMISVRAVGLGLVLASAGVLHAEDASYTKDVKPFLEKYCVECHQGSKAKAGVNLESYESLMKSSRKGQKTVIPGEADKSKLVTTVEGKEGRKMPPKKAPKQPTAKEIEILRAWVTAGAKDDTSK